MTSIRVTAQGPARLAGAALIPVPAPCARAYQSRGLIARTAAVPAPAPPAVPQQWNRALHRSSDAPAVIRPDMRWTAPHHLESYLPVSVSSDNQMPVPAADPRGRPAVMSRAPVFLRQQQVTQPRVTPKFAPRNPKRRR